MKIYRVPVVKKMIKFIEVSAEDMQSARMSALSKGLGYDFSDCYFEYSVEEAVEICRGDVTMCEMP